MNNYEGKLDEIINNCYDNIIEWVKINPTSVSPGKKGVTTYDKELPEPQILKFINYFDGELTPVTINSIHYIDYDYCGAIYLRGQSMSIPVEEIIDSSICSLADYINSL